MESRALVFYVNGKKVVENTPNPEWTLLYYLRHHLRLVGSKEGCGEGGCGACTVMQSRFDSETRKIHNMAINACLTPLCSVHGSAVITVEGIGSVRHGLHPVQERIAKSHGTQCGACTPGFVMSMYALLRNNPKPTEQDMEEAFKGNLCRCTGYRPILDGFRTLCCKDLRNGTNGTCCKAYDANENVEEVADILFDESEFLPYDPTAEIIFPPELQLDEAHLRKQSLKFVGPRLAWLKPSTLKELLELRVKYPNAKLVAGNTEIGVDMKFKRVLHPTLIYIGELEDLQTILANDNIITFGAGVALTALEQFCITQKRRSNGNSKGTVYTAIEEILRWFGGQQVKNVATIGGNLITASPIADLNPLWLAVGAQATVISAENGARKLPINSAFFKSYRQTLLAADEILLNVQIPCPSKDEYVWSFKQSRRKEDDISIVTTSMWVKLNLATCIITDARVAFGGMSAVTGLAESSTSFLKGRKWNRSIVQEVAALLPKDFQLPENAPGGMISYRQSITSSLFFKFFLTVSNWIVELGLMSAADLYDQKDISAVEDVGSHNWGEAKTAQLYQIVPKSQNAQDLVGRPIVHLSGLKHATGEAEYTDDMAPVQGELFGSLVLSTVAHGKILNIDTTAALKLAGVVDFLDAKSIPQKNQEIFASNEVTCEGDIIGFIVATDPLIAEAGARLVSIQYELLPAIVSIEQAIQQESFFITRTLRSGKSDLDAVFSSCDHVIEGEMRLGGQEHFYLETQSCIVRPHPDGDIDVYSAAQGLDHVQSGVAGALGMSHHKVKVHCRRIGGGFGGKETRNVIVAIVTAVAAQKLNKAVRTVMNRQDDMVATGGRHPFHCNYKVGFGRDGRISVVKAKLYSNAGNSVYDGSRTVMERAMLSMDAAYTIPNWELVGSVCKTNLASNTAFRGYGGPQSAMFCENIMDAVAETLGRPTIEIRRMHLKVEGDRTPCGWQLENVSLTKCWSGCFKNSEYEDRLKKVNQFNEENRWRKRGLAIMPIKHDVGFGATVLNQAGALVLVYTDGSVSLNFGGVEMGQGLVTKMVQIASRVLEISADKIWFSECSTDKVPNATATCGSMSSDLNGMAVIEACEKLRKRLKPYKDLNPDGSWEDWVSAAYLNRVCLSATGFYEMGHLNYDFDNAASNVGKQPSNYPVFGVACTEVEIDCLTGFHTLLRTDIVMDAGESLNPAVDIGQIEGAFIQGYGLFCMEELLYSPEGLMLTKGPGSYKIPTAGDIPKEFYVSLLRGSPNPKAVYSSKGLGEPPLVLSASAYFAIKEAIKAFRIDQGHSSLFRLDCPATVERVRNACPNSSLFQEKDDESRCANKCEVGGVWAVRA